jgi:hypothetical protein
MMETGPHFFARSPFRLSGLRISRKLSRSAISEEKWPPRLPGTAMTLLDKRGAKPRIITTADREERSAAARPGHEEETAAHFPL